MGQGEEALPEGLASCHIGSKPPPEHRVIPKITASPVLTATSAVDPVGADTVPAEHPTTATTPTKLPRTLAQGRGLPSLEVTAVAWGSGP